jgi:hypothetical protein
MGSWVHLKVWNLLGELFKPAKGEKSKEVGDVFKKNYKEKKVVIDDK